VKAGKTRYIGASTMYACSSRKALGVAEKNNWTRFVSMQNFVNLMYREEEREMLPCARRRHRGDTVESVGTRAPGETVAISDKSLREGRVW